MSSQPEPAEPPQPASGPPPAPSPTPILVCADERHRKLLALLAAPPETLDPEYVHDLRVLTRRVTEVVRLMKPLFDPAVALGIGEALRDLRKAAAELRDLDVLAEHLSQWRMPPPLGHVSQRLLDELPARRAELERQLRHAISSTTTQGLLMLLSRTLDPAQAGATAESRMNAELRKLIRRRRKKMEKLFGKAAHKQTDVSLHTARIGVKKLRYAVEIGQAAEIRGAASATRALKAIQELLGKHHDVSVIVEVLTESIKQPIDQTPGEHQDLLPAWRKWNRRMKIEQARRASRFFLLSYLWRNGKQLAALLRV